MFNKRGVSMKLNGSLAKARKYIESHSKLRDEFAEKKIVKPGPCITISRQCGIDTESLCENLITSFNLIKTDDTAEWAVFDKNLIEKVIKDHDLPERLNKFLSEEKISTINSMLNELLGVHPPILKLVHKTSSTILKLAQVGNVIIVGRGANIITSHLKNTFHVRLIAPKNIRRKNIEKKLNVTRKEAEEILEREDKARKEYIETYFRKDIDDPLLYDVVINTAKLDEDMLMKILRDMIVERFPKFFKKEIEIYQFA